ncbi:NAD-P-binding protein [Athelia psychrophila]|uniref:NAD-P-binding protein n=1 Tax=Athelia psychrophila TaxID=1759441 RepID=A0A166X3H9_9AGAM|nr:NAD-P-binding protein [Fibularhizoctonia sp. CBS 109695]
MVNILITGATGYIGGTVLEELVATLPASADVKVFTTVRKEGQAKPIKARLPSVTVLLLDVVEDGEGVRRAIIDNAISVVVETVDAFRYSTAGNFLNALAEVKKASGLPVHFVHTSGAKLFSSHAGVDTSQVLSDTSDVFSVQKAQKSADGILNQASHTSISRTAVIPVNNAILAKGEALGVKSYIVVPPMVYGSGKSTGNTLSIQIVAVVRVARDLGKLPALDPTDTMWALCHIEDLTSLYTLLIRGILANTAPSGPTGGFYFAENGSFSWKTLSQAILTHMGLDTALEAPDDGVVEKIAKVLGCSPAWVPISMAGSSNLRGDNARSALGWKPKYDAAHLSSVVAEETDRVIETDAKVLVK